MANWIKFVEVNMRDNRKTCVWAVLTADGKHNLGHVSWYAPWRKYTFAPNPMTVFEWVCLRDIAEFCQDNTACHKNKLKQDKEIAS
jgi:hypothetical protein